MKHLKKALIQAGFTASKPLEKDIPKYKIFHLPSAQYVCVAYRKKGEFFFDQVIVRGKAAAGHIRDCVTGKQFNPKYYRFQNNVPKTQLHKSCFDFQLVVEDDKDSSK